MPFDQRETKFWRRAIDDDFHRIEQLPYTGNGRADATCSAIHGEYSKTFASAATKSSLPHAFKSESVLCEAITRSRTELLRTFPEYGLAQCRQILKV